MGVYVSVLYVLMHLADKLLSMCMEGWVGVCVFMTLMATGSSQVACLLVMLVISQHSRVLRLSKLLTEHAIHVQLTQDMLGIHYK